MTEKETVWKNYVGAKIINATPMDEDTFLREVKGKEVKMTEGTTPRAGYCVTYPSMNNEQPYQSWSPHDVFENAYRELTEGEARMVRG